MNLRILSYNIAKFKSRVPHDIIVQELLALNPDIIALQEVSRSSSLLDTIEISYKRQTLLKILKKAGFETFWSPASGAARFPGAVAAPFYMKEDGLLTAVKTGGLFLKKAKRYVLSEKPFFVLGTERRIVQELSIGLKERQGFNFYNLHLTHRHPVKRLEEIKALKGILKGKRSYVIAGDFNMPEGSDAYHKVVDLGVSDTFRRKSKKPGITWSWENTILRRLKRTPIARFLDTEDRRFDYIFTSKGLKAKVKSSSVVLKNKIRGHNLSDHYGVLTELEI